MTLPAGFYPVVQTFGVDQYRVVGGREYWTKYWWNDTPSDPNWPVFIEGVVVPKAQAPKNWNVFGGLLDSWPRTVYYGGPITRSLANDYRKSFEKWAKEKGYAYETDVIPVQPNKTGMRHPRTDFVWYIASETRPPKRYRFVRGVNQNNFRWVDFSFDPYKYANFHRLYPTVT